MADKSHIMEINVIDTRDMPKSEQQSIGQELWFGEGGFDHIAQLKSNAREGTVTTPQTVTSTYHGESKEAALGRAYALRDKFRDAGYTCDASLTGRAWKTDTTTFYEFDLTIEDK